MKISASELILKIQLPESNPITLGKEIQEFLLYSSSTIDLKLLLRAVLNFNVSAKISPEIVRSIKERLEERSFTLPLSYSCDSFQRSTYGGKRKRTPYTSML